MSRNGNGILADGTVMAEELRQAMGEAIPEALRAHERAGIPAATMHRDGTVVLVPPEEIAIPDEDESEDDAKMRNGCRGSNPQPVQLT
jgi:hypothetical protein